jgi:hypothetical protein
MGPVIGPLLEKLPIEIDLKGGRIKFTRTKMYVDPELGYDILLLGYRK